MGVISVAKCDAQNALSYIRNIPDVESADFDAKISIYIAMMNIPIHNGMKKYRQLPLHNR